MGFAPDAFDFTTKPTTAEAPSNDPAQMFQQIMQQLTQGQGAPDAFDFATEQTAPEKYMEFKLKEVLISGVIQNGDGDGHNDGGIIIDFTPGPDDNRLTVDPTDPTTTQMQDTEKGVGGMFSLAAPE